MRRSVGPVEIGIDGEALEIERCVDARARSRRNREQTDRLIAVEREGAVVEGQRRSVPPRLACCREVLQAPSRRQGYPGPPEEAPRVVHVGLHVALELQTVVEGPGARDLGLTRCGGEGQ